MTTPLLTSSSNEEPVDQEWEKEDKRHFTEHEKRHIKKMVERGFKDEVREGLRLRRIWKDGMGTSINQTMLYQYFEKLTGEKVYP